MKHYLFLFATILAVFAITETQAEQRPPNIVFFLVDDLGWSDVGFSSPKNENGKKQKV